MATVAGLTEAPGIQCERVKVVVCGVPRHVLCADSHSLCGLGERSGFRPDFPARSGADPMPFPAARRKPCGQGIGEHGNLPRVHLDQAPIQVRAIHLIPQKLVGPAECPEVHLACVDDLRDASGIGATRKTHQQRDAYP